MLSIDEQITHLKQTVMKNCADRISEAAQKCKDIKRDYEDRGITMDIKKRRGL